MRQIDKDITLFLIGATGDLSCKKILKSIYGLHRDKILPADFKLVGNARQKMSLQEFKDFVRSKVEVKDNALWKEFSNKLYYVAGDVQDAQTFQRMVELHDSFSKCGNHIWYLATLPSLYRPIISGLSAAGLNKTECGWTKILLEKPFGMDLSSAQELNRLLLENYNEDQIYRIDHFLAKETVQNILAFRFANTLFEHHWNNDYIKEIQVQGLEEIGIDGREKFYDQTGVVRDVVQNHILQMLAVTLMEEPSNFGSDSIRKKRTELLSKLRVSKRNGKSLVSFGQYVSSSKAGNFAKGYKQLKGIEKNSTTPTAVALVCHVNNDRWRGVPIFIKAGKRLDKTVTEISIVFKTDQKSIFDKASLPQENILTLRVQPNEGIVVRLCVKKPGLEMKLEGANMQFCYKTEFQMGLVSAYKKLIYDVVTSDSTLFSTAEGIEASWKAVQPILEADYPVIDYQIGSSGPLEFDELLATLNTSWIVPSIDVCELPLKRKE